MFPLKKYKYSIPIGDDLGAFGVCRKFDIHTGVDLYCEEGDEVFAIEDGEIISIKYFTGPSINMPWWNDTFAVGIKGKSGIINYGEIQPNPFLNVGDIIKQGELIGNVIPVLKKDKGKVPSINMLHLELYSEYDGDWIVWQLNTPQPPNLLNPTELLLKLLEK